MTRIMTRINWWLVTQRAKLKSQPRSSLRSIKIRLLKRILS